PFASTDHKRPQRATPFPYTTLFRSPLISSPAFLLSTVFGDPVPPKEPPRSDEKCLPQSASQLQPQSLTRLTTLCLFVERSLSNVCAKGRVVTITGTEARDFLSKIESHVRSSEAKHPADLRRPQEVCNSSIQKNDPSALKPLGVRYRTASGSDRPWVRGRPDCL